MAIKFNTCTRMRDLRELVNYAADKYGDRTAYKEIDDNREIIEYSFNQLKSDTEALGVKLAAEGMQGKHIALIGPSSYSYVVSYLATVNWVGVIVPIDRELTNDDIVNLLQKSDAEGILFADSYASAIPYFLEHCPRISLAVNISSKSENLPYSFLQELIDSGQKAYQPRPHRMSEH